MRVTKQSRELANPISIRPYSVDHIKAQELVANGMFSSLQDALRDGLHRGLQEENPMSLQVAAVLEALANRHRKLANEHMELVSALVDVAGAVKAGFTEALDDFVEHLEQVPALASDNGCVAGVRPGAEVQEVGVIAGVRPVVIVNSNRQGSQGRQDEIDMLNGGYAATYYHEWQEQLESAVKKGAVVIIYASGVGAIAYGITKDIPHRRAYAYDPQQPNDFESYVDLDQFHIFERPLSAREMKDAVQYNLPLVRAVNTLANSTVAHRLYQYLKERR